MIKNNHQSRNREDFFNVNSIFWKFLNLTISISWIKNLEMWLKGFWFFFYLSITMFKSNLNLPWKEIFTQNIKKLLPKFAHMWNDIYRIVTKHIATKHTNQNFFLFLVTYIKKNWTVFWVNFVSVKNHSWRWE